VFPKSSSPSTTVFFTGGGALLLAVGAKSVNSLVLSKMLKVLLYELLAPTDNRVNASGDSGETAAAATAVGVDDFDACVDTATGDSIGVESDL
jgi:hypothetical protein